MLHVTEKTGYRNIIASRHQKRKWLLTTDNTACIETIQPTLPLSALPINRSQPQTQVQSTPHSESVSVAIINYNGASYLVETLASVRDHCPQTDDILVIDNQSTDGSIELLENRFPEVRIVLMPRNDGPGPARNRAIAEATHDRVLLLDNDVSPQPDCLSKLTNVLQAHPEAVIAMPSIVYAAKPTHVQFAGADAHFLGTVAPLAANQPISESEKNVTSCTSLISAAFLVDRRLLGQNQLFDEHLFIYQEDHEAGLRCSLSGFALVVEPQAHCLHRDGTLGLSIRETGAASPRRIQQGIYNRWYVIATNYQARTILRFSFALFVYEAVQLAGSLAKGWAGHWLWALKRFWTHRTGILNRRKRNRSLRKLQDCEILKGGAFPFNKETKHSTLQRIAEMTIDLACIVNWAIARPRK